MLSNGSKASMYLGSKREMYCNIQLLNDFSEYIEKYFARIYIINRVAVGCEVDIANSRKIFFNLLFCQS